MAQFDIFANPNKAARASIPYVIVLQSDVSAGRKTIIVAPVVPYNSAQAPDRVTIEVLVSGEPHLALLQGLAAISLRGLGKPVCDAPHVGDGLARAVDYLFLGI